MHFGALVVVNDGYKDPGRVQKTDSQIFLLFTFFFSYQLMEPALVSAAVTNTMTGNSLGRRDSRNSLWNQRQN